MQAIWACTFVFLRLTNNSSYTFNSYTTALIIYTRFSFVNQLLSQCAIISSSFSVLYRSLNWSFHIVHTSSAPTTLQLSLHGQKHYWRYLY